MKKINVILLSLACLFACSRAADAAKPTTNAPAVAPAAYYSTNGKLVGPMVYPNAMVLFRTGDTAVFLELDEFDANDREGFGAKWNVQGGRLVFAQAGCIGPAYLALNFGSSAGLVSQGFVSVSPTTGQYTLYISSVSSTATFVQYSSWAYDYNSKTHVCIEEAAPFAASAPAVTATYDLSTYQLPLLIK